TEVEKAQASTARSAKVVMPKVLASLGLERRCAETEIVKVWNHLLDPNIVAHAQPTGLRKGTLFVAVDSSAWLNEIVRYRRRKVLDRLKPSLGKDLITRISFRIGKNSLQKVTFRFPVPPDECRSREQLPLGQSPKNGLAVVRSSAPAESRFLETALIAAG